MQMHQVSIKDFYFDHGENISTLIMQLGYINILTIQNITFNNFNISSSSPNNFIALLNFGWTITYIDTIKLINSYTHNRNLIVSQFPLDSIIIANGYYSGVIQSIDAPLFSFVQLKSITFIDHEFENVR
jgi:hypothetical protein